MLSVRVLGTFAGLMGLAGCADSKVDQVTDAEAARISRKLVRQAVVYEPGAEDGAVVPDLSAPQLRAIMVPEHIENGRLIEKHREWVLEGDVSILGTPDAAGGARK